MPVDSRCVSAIKLEESVAIGRAYVREHLFAIYRIQSAVSVWDFSEAHAANNCIVIYAITALVEHV